MCQEAIIHASYDYKATLAGINSSQGLSARALFSKITTNFIRFFFIEGKSEKPLRLKR